jgi:hypothetical protein
MKPTFGPCPTPASTLEITLDTVGRMTANVATCAAAEVLAGPDG